MSDWKQQPPTEADLYVWWDGVAGHKPTAHQVQPYEIGTAKIGKEGLWWCLVELPEPPKLPAYCEHGRLSDVCLSCAKTEIERLNETVAKLMDFKAWVHGWLDDNGVPVDPCPQETEKTGCRIGGRLEWYKDKIAWHKRHPAFEPERLGTLTQEIIDGLREIGERSLNTVITAKLREALQ